MSLFFTYTVHFVLTLAMAPLMVGLIRFFKARAQNRRGASLLQPYFAIYSLMKKEMTITKHSSWVFHFVPVVVLSSSIMLALMVPSIFIFTFHFDSIWIFAGLSALGAVFLVMGGMDTASAFGNMGSSREMSLLSIIEPAFFVSITALGILSKNWSINGIIGSANNFSYEASVVALIVVVALILISFLENARYPVDNPATHLELTMVHEAMLLEYSGPYLAILEYASALKLTAFSLLISHILFALFSYGIPEKMGFFALILSIALYVAKFILSALGIAIVETLFVKMRFFRMQEYAMSAFVISITGLLAALVLTQI